MRAVYRQAPAHSAIAHTFCCRSVTPLCLPSSSTVSRGGTIAKDFLIVLTLSFLGQVARLSCAVTHLVIEN